MVGSAQSALILSTDRVRQDLLQIVRAGIDAASAARALSRVLADESLARSLRSTPLHVIAVGKAASEMAAAWFRARAFRTEAALVVSTHRSAVLPGTVEFRVAGHPIPDERSLAAAARALQIARGVPEEHALVLLLSGGASALLARPIVGISLDDKQRVINAMLRGGADIHALNTVRKHMSAVKGGRLADACRGRTITLAISDVVGDDLAVIGSGPGVPDPSTWRDAWDAFNGYVPREQQPEPVRTLLEAGVEGQMRETPKPADPLSARVHARVIASRFDAMQGASAAAARLGYQAVVMNEPVTGEAKLAASAWLDCALRCRQGASRSCVISSGETTVRVRGSGRGGRNQEFALALTERLAGLGVSACVACAGTDGIDGSTDAAGAIVDASTEARAAQLGLELDVHLDDNNSHAFFAALGDLLMTGPTGTNVGDLQVLLTGSDPDTATDRDTTTPS